jgi:CubicO group peptidase (beta-lactamase class C family)
MRFLVPSLLAVTLAASAVAASHKAGMDLGRLGEVPRRMQQFVESNHISGAVTLVARHGKVVALDAVGQSDLKAGRAMKTDDLFWIASMTKPIAAAAILLLQDEGKLSVSDPVEKHLPEFRNQWMIASRSGTNMSLIRAPRAITIHDLLTHTSGLNEMSSPRSHATLAELVMGYSQLPLKFAPGSKWEYCNSGINTLGRIVEVVSGQPFAEFLQERFFEPLGMRDTTFWPSERQLRRVAKSYEPGPNGELKEVEVFFVKGPLSDRRRTAYPAGGLYSTAEDVAKFYFMMLNNGTVRGKRLLSHSAIEELTRTQTGELRTGFVEGMSFGYGFAVVKEPRGITRMMSPGTFGHGGAYGTQVWADPKKQLLVVLMIQRSRLPNADASPMREALQEAAVAALVE